jgi:metal-sulfur cluster biosynthetic enzyme
MSLGADPAVLKRVYAALQEVIDPELGLDVVALGLVDAVRGRGDRVEVDMTLTTPGCPVSEQLPAEAVAALRHALPELSVDVQLVWDPPWTSTAWPGSAPTSRRP